jgi:hypothetical protein
MDGGGTIGKQRMRLRGEDGKITVGQGLGGITPTVNEVNLLLMFAPTWNQNGSG